MNINPSKNENVQDKKSVTEQIKQDYNFSQQQQESISQLNDQENEILTENKFDYDKFIQELLNRDKVVRKQTCKMFFRAIGQYQHNKLIEKYLGKLNTRWHFMCPELWSGRHYKNVQEHSQLNNLINKITKEAFEKIMKKKIHFQKNKLQKQQNQYQNEMQQVIIKTPKQHNEHIKAQSIKSKLFEEEFQYSIQNTQRTINQELEKIGIRNFNLKEEVEKQYEILGLSSRYIKTEPFQKTSSEFSLTETNRTKFPISSAHNTMNSFSLLNQKFLDSNITQNKHYKIKSSQLQALAKKQEIQFYSPFLDNKKRRYSSNQSKQKLLIQNRQKINEIIEDIFMQQQSTAELRKKIFKKNSQKAKQNIIESQQKFRMMTLKMQKQQKNEEKLITNIMKNQQNVQRLQEQQIKLYKIPSLPKLKKNDIINLEVLQKALNINKHHNNKFFIKTLISK